MGLTKIFVAAVAFGIVLTLFAWTFGFHMQVFVFYNLLAVGLFGLDFLLTPKPTNIRVFREKEQHLYFKAENTVVLSVKNTSPYELKIELKDEGMRYFTVTDKDMVHILKPQTEQEFSYTVIPTKRGGFDFTYVYVRYNGILGLCKKYKKIHCPTYSKVYPNIKELGKYRLLMQKSRLLPLGEKSLRQFGEGAEFESLRTYVEGDDYRKINWAASARENKLIVNQYQLERDQNVYIMLDTGRPMSYMVNGFKKLDYSINAAIILTDIVNRQGDKAGLLVFESQVHSHISPGQGALHRNSVLETLYHVADSRQTANYGAAFRALNEKQKRRSLVFIFTDFEIIDEADDLIANISLLKRRHMPIVVFMKNEELEKMANNSDTSTLYNKTLQQTATEFHAERRLVLRRLNAMGIATVETGAENFALAAVNKYLQVRR